MTLLGEGVADDLAASAQSCDELSVEVAAGNRAISRAARPLALRPRLATGLPWSALPSSAGDVNGLNTPWTDVRVSKPHDGRERRRSRLHAAMTDEPRDPSNTQRSATSATPTASVSPPISANPGEVGRVLLLYSGGLDTSVMLKWIQDGYGAEVVALTINLGQPGEDYGVVEEKAKRLGAVGASSSMPARSSRWSTSFPRSRPTRLRRRLPLFTALGAR